MDYNNNIQNQQSNLPDWRNQNLRSIRIRITNEIIRYIVSRRPHLITSSNRDSIFRRSKFIEQHLFLNASSLEEYKNLSTLAQRINDFIRTFVLNYVFNSDLPTSIPNQNTSIPNQNTYVLTIPRTIYGVDVINKGFCFAA
jgi:hypothetical protein